MRRRQSKGKCGPLVKWHHTDMTSQLLEVLVANVIMSAGLR